ncbi:uncharacterized protein LOC128962341 [Oppia nitens]|uniref:uncharacterized protein LOC128962341 n=1 Tax=Oppia nitens TaxID=1686743 RepID=UPI0023DB7A59|nr:uncharacterized protein LOC128962341 [Oppia nitens]
MRIKWLIIFLTTCLSFLFTVYCMKNNDQYLLDNNNDNNNDINYGQLMSVEETIHRVKRKGGTGGRGGGGTGSGGRRGGRIFVGSSSGGNGYINDDEDYVDDDFFCTESTFGICLSVNSMIVIYILLPVPMLATRCGDFNQWFLILSAVITIGIVVLTYAIIIVANSIIKTTYAKIKRLVVRYNTIFQAPVS